MRISVVCPVYNESNYIAAVLDFFTKAAPAEKELWIIDGGSTDNTCAIAEEWAEKYPNIHLLHNPKKYVPYALNAAIPKCKGEVIVRLDAHTLYAPDYFEAVLRAFDKSGAEIVGGPMRAEGNSPFQKAVAYCTSTAFGIGDSSFHDETKEGFTDSVYLGAWKASIFGITGMFDEQMMRNQDDEFHYRARCKGMSIYLDPAIRSTYFPRSNFKTLFRQYYQYGLYKPLVLKKVRSGIRWRHLIPAGFVIYLLAIPCLWQFAGLFSLIPLLLYFLLAIRFAARKSGAFLIKVLVYPTLHISYGLGFILGLTRQNKPINTSVQ
ncbi:MAG: glycosyltransferase family 2 protein [Bacteroidia bacterium]